MADYSVVSGDTFASIAKAFFGSEDAKDALAAINNVKDSSPEPAVGLKLKIPDRLYGLKSQEKQSDKTVITLSLFLNGSKQDCAIVFYSPSLQKYCVLAENEIQGYVNEIKSTQNMAQKILDGWKETDLLAMIQKMKDLASEIESYFDGLANSSLDAINELLMVSKHPKLQDLPGRFFIRPLVLKEAQNLKGQWKELADSFVQEKLKALKDATGDIGLNDNVLSALCSSAKKLDEWPLSWNYSSAKEAATEQGKKYASSLAAQFIRFIAGSGLDNKLDAIEKKLSFGSSGNLTFSLLHGTINGEWYLPSQAGIDLFKIMQVSNSSKTDQMACLLRCQISAKGYATAQGSLSHLVQLPGLTLGKKSNVAGSVSGDATGELLGSLSWSPQSDKPFSVLAKVDLKGELSAKDQLSISFSNKMLQCSVPVKDLKGFSGSGSLLFNVDSQEGLKLIEYIFGCVAHHYISGLTSSNDGLVSLFSARFNHIIEGIEQKTAGLVKSVKEVSSWFGDGKLVDGTAEGEWYIPEKQGFDIAAVIASVPMLKPFLKPNVHCFIRIKIALSGYAFGKASSSGSSPIPSNVSAAAGGKGQLSASIEWKASASEEFRILGSISGQGALSGMAAITLPVPLAVEYKNDVLTGLLSLKAIPGLGVKSDAHVHFTASGAEAKAFVDTLFSGLNVDLKSFLGTEALQGITSKVDDVKSKANALRQESVSKEETIKNVANTVKDNPAVKSALAEKHIQDKVTTKTSDAHGASDDAKKNVAEKAGNVKSNVGDVKKAAVKDGGKDVGKKLFG